MTTGDDRPQRRGSRLFEELDWRETPLGSLTLRRRFDPVLKVELHEVLLGDDFLMSSLFVQAEEELARLGLAAATGEKLSVVVGGLGLGYTARTALLDHRVASLDVVEALDAVIDWHQRGLLPLSDELTSDGRTRFVLGDFFALCRGGDGFDPEQPGRRYDAILLDVDHTPTQVLHPSHADLYTVAGLTRLGAFLTPGGVFALWSNDPPDDTFGRVLEEVFEVVAAHIVAFPNPLQGRDSTNTVYVATGLRP